MSDLVVGVAVVLLALVVVVLPAVLVARWQDRRQARARHCLRRPHPAVVLARDLLGLLPPAPAPATWERIRAGMRPAPRYVDTSRTLEEMAGPIVTEAELREEYDSMCDEYPAAARPPLRPCCVTFEGEPHLRGCEPVSVPMSPDPEVKPFTGWRVPDDWRLPGGRGLMFTRPGKQPWLTGTMPAVPAPPVPAAYDPGDGLTPIPFLPGYAPEPAYGVASCQLDVAEAERLAAAMLP